MNVAERANAKGWFNALPHASGLNQAVSGNKPRYLERKASCQVKTTFLPSHLDRLYIQKVNQGKPKNLATERSGQSIPH